MVRRTDWRIEEIEANGDGEYDLYDGRKRVLTSSTWDQVVAYLKKNYQGDRPIWLREPDGYVRSMTRTFARRSG